MCIRDRPRCAGRQCMNSASGCACAISFGVTHQAPKACWQVLDDPLQACAGADLVTTAVWTSMGFEAENAARQHAFGAWCVTPQLMAQAHPKALFMHCLPAPRRRSGGRSDRRPAERGLGRGRKPHARAKGADGIPAAGPAVSPKPMHCRGWASTMPGPRPVSYTHLTLPTICSV